MTQLSSSTFADLLTFARASTGTYVDSNGDIQSASSGTARLTHDGSGTAKGLLIEEARTNLTPYSEDYLQWTTAGLTNEGDATLANTVGGILFDDSDCQNYGIFDVDNAALVIAATVYDEASGATPVRQVVTFTTPAGCTSVNIRMAIKTGGAKYVSETVSGLTASTEYTASWYHEYDGTDYMVGGLQLEAGSGPTSYIPTSGATATRATETCYLQTDDFQDVWNADAGTVFVEFEISALKSSGNMHLISCGDGSTNNYLVGRVTSAGSVNIASASGGVADGDVAAGAYTAGATSKLAFAFDSAGLAASLDGAATVTDATITLPAGISRIAVGLAEWASGSQLNGTIAEIRYWPEKLADADLEAMTA